jgi:hypothetical protein
MTCALGILKYAPGRCALWCMNANSASRHRATVAPVLAQAPKPNIVVIMGDDIGWFNVGVYHHGIMAGKTPNLDRLAAEGMRFTDYYAEASCTVPKNDTEARSAAAQKTD